MPYIQSPKGWSDRFYAAQARAVGDAVREHNDRVRHALTRKVDLGIELVEGKIGQNDYDLAVLEIDEILAEPSPEPPDAEIDPNGEEPPDAEITASRGAPPSASPEAAGALLTAAPGAGADKAGLRGRGKAK